MVENAFYGESESYKRLRSLQGKGIPHCYGSGRLPLKHRAYFPHVLFLEYIPDAITMKDYDKNQRHWTRPLSFSIMQSLVNTAHAFADHDIIHTDLNDGNILLTPSNNPTRGVIIDFGEACFRENESDEEWKYRLDDAWDVGYIILRCTRRNEFRDTLWPPGYDRRIFSG